MPETSRKSEPAVVRYRASVVENVHAASVAVADPKGRLIAWFGDPERVTWLRSANKSFQALATIETGAADRFGLTQAEVALIASSHNGEDGHVEGVLSILGKIGLDPSALQCGTHPPLDQATAFRVGADYNRLHSNCSGKHSGMLTLARHLGVEPAEYLSRSSRSQRLILKTLAEVMGLRPAEVKVGIDGCGAPTFAVPLRVAAMAYARLATGEELGRHREGLLRLRDAAMAHPWVIGGTGRFDTELMRAFPWLVTKSGAEAFQGVGVLSRSIGIGAKIEDGLEAVLGLVVFEAMKQLRLVTEGDRARIQATNAPTDLRVYNWNRDVAGQCKVVLRLRRA